MSSGKGQPRRGNRRGGVWLGTARAKENDTAEKTHYYDNPDVFPERPQSPRCVPQDGYFASPDGYGRGKQRTKGKNAGGKGFATSTPSSSEYVPCGSDRPLPGDVDFSRLVKGGKKGPTKAHVDFSTTLGSGDVDFGTPQKGSKRGIASAEKGWDMEWWFNEENKAWHPCEDGDECDKWYANDRGENLRDNDGAPQGRTLAAGTEENTSEVAVAAPNAENDVIGTKLNVTKQELRSLLDDARLRYSDETVVRWAGVFDADAFAEEFQLKRLEQRRLRKACNTFLDERKARSPSKPDEMLLETLPTSAAGNGNRVEATPSDLTKIVFSNETMKELCNMSSEHASEISSDLSALRRNPNVLLDEKKEGLADTLETKDGLAVLAEMKDDLVDKQERFMGKLVAEETSLCLTVEEFRFLLKDARLECPEEAIQHWAPFFDLDAFALDLQLKRLEHWRLEKSLDHFLARRQKTIAQRGPIVTQTVEIVPVTSKDNSGAWMVAASSSAPLRDATSAIPSVPSVTYTDATRRANSSAIGSSMMLGANGTADLCVEQRNLGDEKGKGVVHLSNIELRDLLMNARLECPEDVIDRWAHVFDADAFAQDRQLKQLEQRRLGRAFDAFLTAQREKNIRK